METSTYIILALLAIFLFGPVSLITPLLTRSHCDPAFPCTILSRSKTWRW